MEEPPVKRARSSVAASLQAVRMAQGATAGAEGALRAVRECLPELVQALGAVAEREKEVVELERTQEIVRERETAVRSRVKVLAAAENRLAALLLEAGGPAALVAGDEQDTAAEPRWQGLNRVHVADLVTYAQRIAYSTAAPPLVPAGTVSMIPLAASMRASSLFSLVPGLSDAAALQQLQEEQAQSVPLQQQFKLQQQPASASQVC